MRQTTRGQSAAARFAAKVRRNVATGCLLWTASRNKAGYGRLNRGRRGEGVVLAHRFAWEQAYGALPGRLCVLHRCDTPACVEVAHLFLGTHGDNAADKVAKGRQARGDRSGARTHPERLARGDRHGLRLHPECVARGERAGAAKLTTLQVQQIRKKRAAGARRKDLAKEYKIAPSGITRICDRTRWSHVL